jgi:hypothetical protein
MLNYPELELFHENPHSRTNLSFLQPLSLRTADLFDAFQFDLCAGRTPEVLLTPSNLT